MPDHAPSHLNPKMSTRMVRIEHHCMLSSDGHSKGLPWLMYAYLEPVSITGLAGKANRRCMSFQITNCFSYKKKTKPVLSAVHRAVMLS